MKKTIYLILLLLAGCAAAMAQGKKPVKPDSTKAKYNYFVRIPASDYQQIAGSLNEYKRLQMYDPIASDQQKVKLFQGIEAYLKELPSRIKIDSVKIETPKTK